MILKFCPICEAEKDLEEFKDPNWIMRKRQPREMCHKCHKKHLRKKDTEIQKNRTRLRRLRVIEKYGGKCVGCDERRLEFLCIDHIHGGGGKHILQLKGHHGFYKILDNNSVDFETYTILCQSCNLARSIKSIMEEADKNTPSERCTNARNGRRRHRQEVIDYYGGICACCGELDPFRLAIDHINGGGVKHCKEIGGRKNLVRWIRKNKYPPIFRILCHNCNFSHGRNGYCPHNKEKELNNAA